MASEINFQNVNLNIHATRNTELSTIDLNNFPVINGNRDDSELSIVQSTEEVENSIPMIIRQSSTDTLIIDLNMEPNQEFHSPLLELNIAEMTEEEDEEEKDDEREANSDTIIDGSLFRKKNKILSNRERWAIYDALLERSVAGKLKRNTTTEVSNLFGVHIRTIQRIWKQSKNTPLGTQVDVSHRRTKNCGRKRVQIDFNRVLEIPLHRRTTLRCLAESLNVRYTTLFRLVKQGLLRRHTNAIKPHLKEENKIARLEFCLSMLDPESLPHEPKFVDMFNMVHIDEKWFYMTKKSENYYLLPIEEEPLRTCQSKNFIGKVMFLVAMARPRFDNEGTEIFSGKIGVFPFVTMQPAQRKSRNRNAGTLEIKPMTSVKRETVRAYLIEKVIPAIQRKWPKEDLNKTIIIQQDNARTHVDPTDEEFQIAASQNGFDIRLVYQPSNSPDLNILDLGFFRSIQALQHKECPRTVEELIHAVERSFEEYPSRKINHIFLTLQLCMQEIMKVQGSNRYKIPHLNKASLERDGRLPKQIGCDPTLVQDVMNIFA